MTELEICNHSDLQLKIFRIEYLDKIFSNVRKKLERKLTEIEVKSLFTLLEEIDFLLYENKSINFVIRSISDYLYKQLVD